MIKMSGRAAAGLSGVAAWFLACSLASAGEHRVGVNGIVVHTKLGGAVAGFDVDQNGTEGILSEFVSLAGLKNNVAVETFDQATGKILKVLKKQLDTPNDIIAFPIAGTSVGFVDFQKVDANGFVTRNDYKTLNPLENDVFNGTWTPKLAGDEIISGVSENQGSPNTAIMAFENNNNGNTFLFSTNVAANTFGPRVVLEDTVFDFDDVPAMAFDTATNQAVVAASTGCPVCAPKIAIVDLVQSTVTEFQGVGLGLVNGAAVDSDDGIACTATEIDFSIEFYNLATQTGFAVKLPHASSELQSGFDVKYDPIHKLFLIGQPFSSTGNGSSIQVFDTQGNFVESINGLKLPIGAGAIVINPATRSGFAYVTPSGTELQGFDY